MADKTEAPTPRRLADARAEGQVAKSPELAAAATLLVGVWVLSSVGGKMVGELKTLLALSVSNLNSETLSQAGLQNVLTSSISYALPSLGALLIAILITGVVVNAGQTGFLWSQKRMRPDFGRLNPLSGLKRMFSTQGLVELVKAMLKLGVVGWVAYAFLRDRYSEVLALGQTDLVSAFAGLGEMGISLALRVGGAYLVVAMIDYGYQRYRWMQMLRMTKEEVKEDMKRSEGDPFIRSRIRGQQRRMARMRMMQKVKDADVIITNPTHLAVAVQYKADEMHAPRVLAKGADQMAFRIIDTARKHNVAVVQNIPVARALYATVEIDQEIPAELYVPLAEVLAYVYRMRGQRLTSAGQQARP